MVPYTSFLHRVDDLAQILYPSSIIPGLLWYDKIAKNETLTKNMETILRFKRFKYASMEVYYT